MVSRRLLRRVAIGLGIAVALVAVPWLALPLVAGGGSQPPEGLEAALTPAARRVLAQALDGIDPARRLDHHAHVAGVGAEGSGCEVNPRMTEGFSLVERLRYAVYLRAAGVDDAARADCQLVERLLRLQRAMPGGGGRIQVLAFDRRYRPDGTVDAEHSEFYVPNDYVLGLQRAHPQALVAVASVHPYRHDALAELERMAAAGVRTIKWLPNAQGIDPADARCDPFYDRMSAHGMVLLTHTGRELAVEAETDQDLGNPLRLRRPLARGVRVVAAHFASLGDDVDFDDPARPRVPSWRLLVRLLEEPAWRNLLFADISATTLVSRVGQPLDVVLGRSDLHDRLVDGSDWPMPAINVVISTRRLESQGYLTAEEHDALDLIYQHNPLLFDLVLKRTIRHPRTGARLPARVFMAHPDLGRR